MRTKYRSTRCLEGRLMRHDPQSDDPNLETDVGVCPECNGRSCRICECCGGELSGGECNACDTAREEGEKFVAKHGLPWTRG